MQPPQYAMNYPIISHFNSNLVRILYILPGRIQGMVKGGTQIFLFVFADTPQLKWALFGRGPGTTFRALEALGFSWLNVCSLHFEVPLYTIFEIIKY